MGFRRQQSRLARHTAGEFTLNAEIQKRLDAIEEHTAKTIGKGPFHFRIVWKDHDHDIPQVSHVEFAHRGLDWNKWLFLHQSLPIPRRQILKMSFVPQKNFVEHPAYIRDRQQSAAKARRKMQMKPVINVDEIVEQIAAGSEEES